MIFDFFKNKNRAKPGDPEFWKGYLASFEHDYRKNTPIRELRFVVFDTETTGLDVRKDHILSLGAVSVNNWQIDLSDSLECYVRQAYQANGESVEVHGILPNGRKETVDEGYAIRRFISYCQNAVLVGHHVNFDVAMVNKVLKGLTGRKLLNKQVDTAVLARRLAGDSQVYKQGTFGLDSLCQQYHIPMSDRHTAAGDAYITAILLLKLLARLEKRGVRTLGQLFR
ncbi:MAG: 3'-5' exonuclease [Lewinellaceae bacterium]|nr:3'-5' exonuclease [Lewinellaceae bacterium]